MDRFQTMAAFVAVAEENGFAPAARRLGMSAPSVTRAVSALEARLGARLLFRTTRTVGLTEAGRRYLADCRRILAEVADADRQAAGIHDAPSGRVTVTASLLFGRDILMPLLLDLLDRHPALSVTTLFVDRVVHLMNEGIDVAIRIAELPDSGLSAVRVGQVRPVLCASPAYLAARGRPEAPEDLGDHETIEFMHLASGGGWSFRHEGQGRAVRTGSRLLVNSADAAILAAESGRGITRVLSYMIAGQRAGGTLETLLDDYAPPPLPIHVVHKEAGQTSARVRAVVDHLVEHLRSDSVQARL